MEILKKYSNQNFCKNPIGLTTRMWEKPLMHDNNSNILVNTALAVISIALRIVGTAATLPCDAVLTAYNYSLGLVVTAIHNKHAAANRKFLSRVIVAGSLGLSAIIATLRYFGIKLPKLPNVKIPFLPKKANKHWIPTRMVIWSAKKLWVIPSTIGTIVRHPLNTIRHPLKTVGISK